MKGRVIRSLYATNSTGHWYDVCPSGSFLTWTSIFPIGRCPWSTSSIVPSVFGLVSKRFRSGLANLRSRRFSNLQIASSSSVFLLGYGAGFILGNLVDQVAVV